MSGLGISLLVLAACFVASVVYMPFIMLILAIIVAIINPVVGVPLIVVVFFITFVRNITRSQLK